MDINEDSEEETIVQQKRTAYMVVMNRTKYDVDFLKLSDGSYVKYEHIKPGRCIVLVIPDSKPWIAVETKNCNRMLLNGVFLYEPNPHPNILCMEFFGNRIPPPTIQDVFVLITAPEHSLQNIALLKIASYLKSADDADSLNLPNALKNELKTIIFERELYKNRIIYGGYVPDFRFRV